MAGRDNIMSDTSNPYLTHYQELKPTFIGNHLPWLRVVREDSLHRFLEHGFPNRHNENWKYTDLNFLTQQTFHWQPRNETVNLQDIADFILPDVASPRLVFIDGCFSPTLSDKTLLFSEITFISLNEALLTQPEHIRPYLENDAENHYSQLIDLNTAFVNDGVFLHVPANTRITLPLQLLFVTTDASEQTMTHSRNILILEDNSEVNIVEQHISLSKVPAFKNVFTQITCHVGAQLNYYKVQNENLHTIHLARTEITQSRDSQVQSHNITLGGRLTRDDLQVALNAPGAGCVLNGFYAPSGTQHIDQHTRIDHYHAHTQSDECYKGILQDKATGVFNGKVIVHPQAQKIQSQQINQNLLLSKTAQMNTKPELEIYADDVKCAHGATVGQIEPEALFYLRSRGLDEVAATALLTEAFFNDVLERMQNDSIAEYMRQMIMEKL